MKRLYAALLLLSCGISCAVSTRIVTDSEMHSAPATPQLIYMAHCDTTGHYRLVVTDSEGVASQESQQGYWPIPETMYRQLSGNLNSVTCTPAPQDSGH